MKGTAILVSGETYNDRKAFILSCIVTDRKLIAATQATKVRFPHLATLANEVIMLEQQSIKNELAELTELERWRVREGYEKDEPFSYKRIRTELEKPSTATPDTN